MFLSCLRGSEPGPGLADDFQKFLSCLRGSELELKVYKGLIVKEHFIHRVLEPLFNRVG